jgi:hypothetical protein
MPNQPAPYVCDFCNGPDPTWWFPCGDYPMVIRPPVALTPSQRFLFDKLSHLVKVQNTGDWAACDTCKDLILKGQRDELAARSAELFIINNPEESSHLAPQAVTESMRASQDDFWSHREGAPFPISR